NPQHSIVTAGYKNLFQLRDVQDALWLLESRNALGPFTGLKIHHLERSIFQSGNKQALAFHVHIHVVEASLDAGHGYGLHEPERLFRRLRIRRYGQQAQHRPSSQESARKSSHGSFTSPLCFFFILIPCPSECGSFSGRGDYAARSVLKQSPIGPIDSTSLSTRFCLKTKKITRIITCPRPE